ncbi:spermatogenesis-associated protein 19, mitochondrial [Rhea pennata]|uniref:spermatogenesis-associated protein 19, mitochondrial n=1 Tax=Rhea pennata TaxID=8795 RepID=UPI002E260779
MIISTWLAYILAREGTGAPFPVESAQDIPVVEMETLSVLEHWLRKDEHTSDVNSLGPSPSQSFMDDRTKIQFLRWSQTRVYRVSSSIRDEAMQERLDKIRNSVSQVMLQAMRDSVSDTDMRAMLSSEG